MSRSAKVTSPSITVHPTAIVAPAATLTGIYPITIGANTIVHPRATLTSRYGPVSIGIGCIIGERTIVGLQSKSSVNSVVVGHGVTIESGARVQGNVGDSSVLEIGASVELGSMIGKVGGNLYLNIRTFLRLCVESLLLVEFFALVPRYTSTYQAPFDLEHYGEASNGTSPKHMT